MDTVLSFGVCFGFICGLLLQRMGSYKMTPCVDPVMAIILASILIGVPFKTVMHNVLELLDAAPEGNCDIVIRFKPDKSVCSANIPA